MVFLFFFSTTCSSSFLLWIFLSSMFFYCFACFLLWVRLFCFYMFVSLFSLPGVILLLPYLMLSLYGFFFIFYRFVDSLFICRCFFYDSKGFSTANFLLLTFKLLLYGFFYSGSSFFFSSWSASFSCFQWFTFFFLPILQNLALRAWSLKDTIVYTKKD